MLGTIPPSSCPNGSFIVEVRHNGIIVPNATVNHDHVGKVLEAKVIDTNSGNSCWGYLHIEDKLPPVILCDDPDDIYCFELDNYEPTVVENCGTYTLEITAESITNNNCNIGLPANVLKVVSRTYVAIDKSGNRSQPCTIEFDVLAIDDLSISMHLLIICIQVLICNVMATGQKMQMATLTHLTQEYLNWMM